MTPTHEQGRMQREIAMVSKIGDQRAPLLAKARVTALGGKSGVTLGGHVVTDI